MLYIVRRLTLLRMANELLAVPHVLYWPERRLNLIENGCRTFNQSGTLSLLYRHWVSPIKNWISACGFRPDSWNVPKSFKPPVVAVRYGLGLLNNDDVQVLLKLDGTYRAKSEETETLNKIDVHSWLKVDSPSWYIVKKRYHLLFYNVFVFKLHYAQSVFFYTLVSLSSDTTKQEQF